MHRAATAPTRGARALVAWFALEQGAVSQTLPSTSVCPFAPADASSIVYLPVGVGGLMRLWRGGNALWGETCGTTALANDHRYRLFVAADATGTVHYEDAVDESSAIAASVDTSTRRPPLDPTNAGVMIASTNFCPACADFEIRLSHVQGGWSAYAADDARSRAAVALASDARQLAFGAAVVGGQTPSQPIVFTNDDSDDVHPAFAITADGAPHCGEPASGDTCANELALSAGSFFIDASACAVVPAHGTCTLRVTFAPRAAFGMRAKLAFGDPGRGAVQSVTLEEFRRSAARRRRRDARGRVFRRRPRSLLRDAAARRAGAARCGRHRGLEADRRMVHRLPAGTRRVARRVRGLPLLRSARGEARLALLFGIARRMRRGRATLCAGVAARDAGAFRHRAAGSDVRPVRSGRPIYRLWNAAASSNRRYTTDAATRATMLGAGWVAEGYGDDGVAMCDASR